MAQCKFCNSEFIDERFEAGYEYCFDRSCQIKGMDEKDRAFLQVYTIGLLHKSGYQWIRKDNLKSLNTKGDLLEGW